MPDLVPIPSPGVALEYGEPGSPLVVVVHDRFGRLPAVVAYAESLVPHGFRVSVPDLFDGFATRDAETADGLVAALDLGFALASLDEAVDDGRAEGSAHVAVVGFGCGGWIALLHAEGGSEDAVVAFYASLEPKDHGVIPCAVQLHLAEYDRWAPGQDPDDFVDRLRDHGTPISRFGYLATRAGFANASVPAESDANAAALAFARTSRFLEEHLFD